MFKLFTELGFHGVTTPAPSGGRGPGLADEQSNATDTNTSDAAATFGNTWTWFLALLLGLVNQHIH